jgi:hypothetical protein
MMRIAASAKGFFKRAGLCSLSIDLRADFYPIDGDVKRNNFHSSFSRGEPFHGIDIGTSSTTARFNAALIH